MASRGKNKKSSFAWVEALGLYFLFCLFAFAFAKLVEENRTAIGEEFVNSSDAVLATQDAISKSFADLVPKGADQREFWATEIETQLAEGDITVASGLLLSAPDMLNKKDAGAVIAAANTDRAGSTEERLIAAATLFLPDDVRARYERSLSPTDIETLTLNTVDEEPIGAENETSEASNPPSEEPVIDEQTDIETAAPVGPTTSFSVLGNERDLAFQAAGWLRGDKTDLISLKLSGLGLAIENDRIANVRDAVFVVNGASLMKSARRANRLQPEFSKVFERHLNKALSDERLRDVMTATFSGEGSLFIQSDAVLDAFAEAVNPELLAPVLSDLRRIAQLADDRPQSDTMTILEAIRDQRDLKRAELITFAGGDRAIALTKYQGSNAFKSAKTVMDWTMNLILLIVANVALLIVMLVLSFTTMKKSFRIGKRVPASSYHY